MALTLWRFVTLLLAVLVDTRRGPANSGAARSLMVAPRPRDP